MKNLKPLIFSAHSELKSALPSVKKSHLYEAIASFCGFKSYAAFKASFEITVEDIEQANRRCFERMEHLGFDVAGSLLICQHTEGVWARYNVFSLDDIHNSFCESSFEERLLATRMLEALRAFAVSGDQDAILIGLVFTTQVLSEYEENPDNRSGEYWYKKQLANNDLNNMQREVAETYQRIMPYREFLDFLYLDFVGKTDTTLPSPSIIKSVCKQFDDRVERHWSKWFCNEPYQVLEAIYFILQSKDSAKPVIPHYLYLDWLKADVIVDPSRNSIAELMHPSISGEEKWFWHYIGLQHGVDITESNLRAINAYTGEDYDDYGPMDVVGDEGLHLPPIPGDIKAKLENMVAKLTS